MTKAIAMQKSNIIFVGLGLEAGFVVCTKAKDSVFFKVMKLCCWMNKGCLLNLEWLSIEIGVFDVSRWGQIIDVSSSKKLQILNQRQCSNVRLSKLFGSLNFAIYCKPWVYMGVSVCPYPDRIGTRKHFTHTFHLSFVELSWENSIWCSEFASGKISKAYKFKSKYKIILEVFEV